MPETIRRSITPLVGFPSAEVGSFLDQMDDQLRRLTEQTRGLSREELAWQPAPGMNTIGMLLAHNAIVEVFWTSHMMQIEPDVKKALGIGEDDDGMPLPEDGKPPATLAGKDLAFYDALLAKARAFCKAQSAKLTEADLAAIVTRTRPDGTVVEINKRWILYHMLEHFAGHYGQVNLLRHQYKSVQAGKAAAR